MYIKLIFNRLTSKCRSHELLLKFDMHYELDSILSPDKLMLLFFFLSLDICTGSERRRTSATLRIFLLAIEYPVSVNLTTDRSVWPHTIGYSLFPGFR